jgi:hypothetical protein
MLALAARFRKMAEVTSPRELQALDKDFAGT